MRTRRGRPKLAVYPLCFNTGLGPALYIQNINVEADLEPMDLPLDEWPWDQPTPCVCVLGLLQGTQRIFRACTSTFF